jgi:peptidoglycan hydrolase-like protein with peptidoglycan-binding domain
MVPQMTSNMTTVQVGDVEDTELTCTDLQYTLKLRSKDATTNNEVTKLQEFLLDIGLLDTDPTGYFGAATLKAVKAFQKQSGLINSGLVGEYTRKAIKERSCGGYVKLQSESGTLEKPVLEKNMLIIYLNGQQHKTVQVNTKDEAYRTCKEVINSNFSMAMVVLEFKCVWGGEVIYKPSQEVMGSYPKTKQTVLVIYKNGETLAKVISTSKEDAYLKCKSYQEKYPSSELRCLWGEDVIYVTNNQGDICNSEQTLINGVCKDATFSYTCPSGKVVQVPQGMPTSSILSKYCDGVVAKKLATLVVYKNGEEIKRATLVSKDEAYNKCKYVQASYLSTAIKCTWNEEVIYTTSNEMLEKSKEPANDFKFLNSNGSLVPDGQSVLGASTMCVNLKRNFHRGDESDDTRLLQTFLISQEFMDGEMSGFYGDKTVEAVKRYQRIRGLPETGMVYDFTREMIMKETCN